MTTTVVITLPFLHVDKVVQIVRRFPATNAETIVASEFDSHITVHIWDGCELVIRELDAPDMVKKTDE